ncbi:hypothetical protein CLOM_g13941, partial [Closterium sp. NIES-68]
LRLPSTQSAHQAFLATHEVLHPVPQGGAEDGAEDGAAIPTVPELTSYSSVALLDPRFELFWSVNSSDATIHVAARAQTAGWLAIGISEIGSMVGSDALVAWVAETEGRVYATDRFIFDKSGPALDAQQDWHVLGGSQATNQSTGDTWTTVHAWRKLDTGDCNDRPIVPGKLHNLIWAIGSTDDVSYHGSTRGGSSLLLAPAPGPSILSPPPPSSSSSAAAIAAEADAAGRRPRSQGVLAGPQQQQQQESMLKFTVSGYRVPTNHTTYQCKVVDVPLKVKTHAVEWGAVLNSTHISAVHHAFLYGCKPEEYASLPPVGLGFDCMYKTPCSTFVAVWAWGGRPFTFPDNVGYPIGPSYFTKFVLEMHYTNPEAIDDIIDSSGIYLKLAPAPTLMDASIMKVGLVDHRALIRIPPGMPSWTQAGSCPSECTASVFKNESVKLIGSILHQHNIGRQMYTEVIRGGSEVATINRIDYYDFASQQTVPVLPEFELLPGDELRTTCVWDSTARETETKGGLAAEDEMCVDYLVYYPARHGQDMHSCYEVCASDNNGTLTMDPTSPNLSTFHVCGSGSNSLIPSNQRCTIDFGANKPLSVVNGCPTQTQASLAGIPPEAISAPLDSPPPSPPAAALSPPAPASPSPPTALPSPPANSPATTISPPATALSVPAAAAAAASPPDATGKAAPATVSNVLTTAVMALLYSFLALLF